MSIMFEDVFDFTMKLEGGLVLHTNPTEETETYAGIYRAAHPNWVGWVYIDEGETPPIHMVRDFYKSEFWDRIRVDNELVKGMLFEYGVNAGIGKAMKIMQAAVGAKPDGVIGPKTEAMINKYSDRALIDLFTLEKIDMYVGLVNANSRKYGIYLRGWMNRAMNSREWFKKKVA